MKIGKRYFIQKKETNSNTIYSYKRWEYRGETEIGHLFTYLYVDYIIPNDEIDEFFILKDNCDA